MGTDMQTAATKFLNNLPDQAKAATDLVNGSFGKMNDAIVKFAETSKLSFADLFGFMAEEFIKNTILMSEKALLLDQAGGFTMNSPFGKAIGGMFSDSGTSGSNGSSSMFGTVVSAIAGLFGPHADGLDYVPYDGYPAILHKGERVQTAMQRSQSTSAGNAQHFDFSGQVNHFGSNVSRPEIAAALQVSQQQTVEQIRRLTRQGRFA